MANRKTLKQLIQEVNFGIDPFLFSIKENSYIIINPNISDPGKILAYLNANEDIDFEQATNFAWKPDTDFRDFVDGVSRFGNAPGTFIYDWIKNGSASQTQGEKAVPTANGVVELSTVPLNASAQSTDNNIYVIKFNSPKTAQIIENGIGKNFVWCKVAFKHIIDGVETTQFGYTKIENIINNSSKVLIKDEFPTTFSALQLLSPEIREKISAVSELAEVSAASILPNKIVLDKNTASYVALVNTSFYAELNTLTDEQIKAELERVLKEAVAKILEFEKRDPIFSEIVEGRQLTSSFIDKYYLFGKIQDNYFSPRPAEPLYILVSVPVRNIYAVTSASAAAAGDVLEAILSTPSNLQDLTNKISNAYTFNLEDRIPNISNFLASTSPNGALANTDFVNQAYNNEGVNGFVDGLPLLGSDARTSDYVTPSDGKDVLNRKVLIKVSNLDQTFDKAIEALEFYSNKINEEEFEKETAKFNITLSPYVDDIRSIKQATKDLISSYRLEDFTDAILCFSFNKAILKKVFLYKTGNPSDVTDVAYVSAYIQDYYSDETVNFFVCNINSLALLETGQKPLTSFLSEYIIPVELAQYQYTDKGADQYKPLKEDEDSKNCQKNYLQQLKQQAKTNTNEFIANTRLVESTKNFKATFNFNEDYKVIADSAKKFEDVFSTKRGVGVFDPYKVDWNALISDASKCIINKETRKTVEWLLIAIKDKYLNDKPIACSIPLYKLPKLPVIKLPAFPHLPSILNSFVLQTENKISNSSNDILKTIIKSAVESLDFCQEPDNAINIGESGVDDLFLGTNQQPLTNNPASNQNDNRQNRFDQFKGNNLLNGFDNEEDVYNEIILLLDTVSQNLTKQELINLYSGSPTERILSLVKTIIINLVGPPDQLPNLKLRLGFYDGETYITSKRKIIDFFGKFFNLLDPSVLEQEVQLSNDPDILCKDVRELDESYSQALKNRGLSEQEAAEETAKRREELRKKLAELVDAINLLNKDSLQPPPINCQKNPDGSITPGLLDSIPEPAAFELARKKHLEAMYAPFDSGYNQDFKSWFSTTIEETPELTGSEVTNINTDFLKTFSDVFEEKSTFTGNSQKISFTIPKFSLVASNSDESVRNTAYLSQLDIDSNQITYDLNYSLSTINNSSSLIITSSFLSNNLFTADASVISNTDLRKIREKLTYNSTYAFSSSVVDLKQFSNESLSLDNRQKIIKKYFNILKDNYKNSIYFLKTEDTVIKKSEDDVGKQSFSPVVKKLNLNPVLTKKEKFCKKPDNRLINNLQQLKDNLEKANKSSTCIPPELNDDGVKTSPSLGDLSNYDAVINLLLRIYAIDFNLKLLPFGGKVQTILTESFFRTCYEIFTKDIEKTFGKIFKNKILNILSTNYLISQNIEITDIIKLQIDSGLYGYKAFYEFFREKHFATVNKQIIFLLNDKINEKNIDKQLAKGEDKIFLFDKKTFNNLLDYEFQYIDSVNVTSINVTTTEELQLQQEKDRLLRELDQSLNSIAELASKTNVGGISAVFALAVGLSQEQQKNIAESNLQEVIDEYPNSVQKRKARNESVGNTNIDAFKLGAIVLLISEVLPKKVRIPVLLNEIEKKQKLLKTPEEILKKPFFIDTSNGNASLKLITIDYSVASQALNLLGDNINARQNVLKQFLNTSVEIYTKQNVQEPLADKDIKTAFTQYFTNFVPFEEIYSSLLSSCLLSLTSINKINSVFNSSKKEIKNIFDTVEYASDHTKDIEDDGMTEIFSKLKVAVKIPAFMVQSTAEAIDPNVAVASKISLAYESGVALATAAGIDIPVKKLPLFVTSPLLFPSFLFPLSPFGIPAILLSLKDINIDSDSSTITDDDKEEKC